MPAGINLKPISTPTLIELRNQISLELKTRQRQPGDNSRALEAISNAGPNGITYTTLRSVSRAMRRSFESGIPLPSELARAGVTVEKVGKGLRYYAPTF